MYECPNCGGNLRFDIPTQSLFCDYCHTQLNPYSYQKDHDAVETSTYDVNIFTCPQCGGEILSTENAATEFSYVPNAVSLKYPSPLGPNPDPGVPTTLAFSKR